MYQLYTSDTKNVILKNAILLFAELGYARVSMRQIAEASGIEAPSIYNHYPSKHSIMESVLDYFECVSQKAQSNRRNILAMIEKNAPVRDILFAIFFFFPDEDRDYCLCCNKILYTEQFVNDRAKNILTELYYESVRTEIRFYLNELISRNRLKAIDTDKLAEVWARCVFFITFQEAHQQHPTTTPDGFKEIMAVNEYLIRCCETGEL